MNTRAEPCGARPCAFDPLLEVMLHLEATVNTNSLQMVLVEGALDRGRLREAIERVAPRFPLLTSRPDVARRIVVPAAWDAADLPLTEVRYGGRMDFSCEVFRQFVTALSSQHPVRWRNGPPVAFWLIQSHSLPRRSCVLVTVSHATADAKSDSMFMEALGRAYACDEDRAPATHGYSDLTTRYRPPVRHLAGGLIDAMREALREDASAPRYAASAAGTEVSAVPDFHVERLSPAYQRMIKHLTKATGASVNSVFSAALGRTIRRGLVNADAKGPIRLMCAVSLRHLAGPGAARDYRNYMLPCRIRVNPELEDAALLSDIGRQTRTWKTDRIGREFWKAAAVTHLLRRRVTRRLASLLIDRIQGTIAAYSNPGVIEEDFRSFGDGSLPIVGYGGFGCLVPPLRFILYTPQVNGVLHLNAIYRPGCFNDFKGQVIEVLKDEIRCMYDRQRGFPHAVRSGGDRL